MDWIAEWKRLQDRSALYKAVKRDQEESYWSKYALNYDERRRSGDGLSRELETIEALLNPSMSVLEIGAGTGVLTLSIARRVNRVTVVEPSPSMLKVLGDKLVRKGIDNVRIVNSRWEDAEVEPHDVVLAAGCLYVFYDIDVVLRKMLQTARRGLILTAGGWQCHQLYEEAARILGVAPPSIGPEIIHVYNVLYQLGIYANVHIMRTKTHVTYESLEHAVDIWSERLELSQEKLPLLKQYLQGRLSETPLGKLTLEETERVASVIWCWKDELRSFPSPG